jgi:L-asparaginase
MPRVVMVFTGGTISTLPDAAAGGNVPVLNGRQILDRSPEVASLAEIETIDWGLVPASHLRFGQILSIARLAAEHLRRDDVDGVVIVQGTDSIEETASAYDLLLATDKPVVVTGAMRDSSSAEFDGPRNLADSVRCVTSSEMRGRGVNVVMAGLVIGADQVVKTHTTALDTFKARDGEPVARVAGDNVELLSAPRTRQVLPLVPEEPVEDVHLVTATVGMDGALIRALAVLRPRGLVVAATGSGNTHPDLLAGATELMATGATVVLSTRCPTGQVEPMYAFPGGGALWQRAGAILSDYDGPKSRVALALALACGLARDDIARLVGPSRQQ